MGFDRGELLSTLDVFIFELQLEFKVEVWVLSAFQPYRLTLFGMSEAVHGVLYWLCSFLMPYNSRFIVAACRLDVCVCVYQYVGLVHLTPPVVVLVRDRVSNNVPSAACQDTIDALALPLSLAPKVSPRPS
eukprot:2139963-Amphidinium_carterae.1